MAARLKLDTVALRDAGTSLRVVAQEFNDANANSDGVADAVGHAGLASCVVQFARGWDDRRATRVESIGGLATACTGVDDGFESLDTYFDAALRGDR